MGRAPMSELIRRLARTKIGKDLIHRAVLEDATERRLSRVEAWPDQVRGFEDLTFLFSSNQLNHGIASLQFDEAALLYRIARDAGPATLAEIGRFKGGSTLITAAAMHPEAELWSYDLHVEFDPEMHGARLDQELSEALERFGLASRTHLVMGDSRTVDPPPGALASLFVDGDHTYEGARADFDRWRAFVTPGGHLLFHDAVAEGTYGLHFPGVARIVDEIDRDAHEFERLPNVGSIAHFVRRRGG